MEDLAVVTYTEFVERDRLFQQKYKLMDIIENGEAMFSRKHLQNRKKRICRFCNRSTPEATFVNDSHLISRFLGNIDLFSDFECDACNNKFSRYETDLSYFLGISRSFQNLSSKGKAPSLVVRKLSAKSRSFAGDNILIISKTDLNEENSLEDRKAGITKITYSKSPYIPLNVHKALVKAALSVLPENEVRTNYQMGLKYLQDPSNVSGVHIYGYLYPFQINLPLQIYVYEKQNESEVLPKHIFGFYFQNRIIYLSLRLHKDEIHNFGKEIELPYAPPYFLNNNPIINIHPSTFDYDLSSQLKQESESETITFMISADQLKNSHKYDPVSGEFLKTEHGAIDVKYIIVTRENMTLTKEQVNELTELLKKEEASLTAK